MMTCRKVFSLGSDVIDKQLSLKQRIAVFIHLRQCKNCRLYIKQLTMTSVVLQALVSEADGTEVATTLKNIQWALAEHKG